MTVMETLSSLSANMCIAKKPTEAEMITYYQWESEPATLNRPGALYISSEGELCNFNDQEQSIFVANVEKQT